MPESERRLAAIMFTDIVGYTALSQKNEALAMQLLEEHRELLRPFFTKHGGREVKTMGDAFLVEFASALEAVRCAFDVQQSLQELKAGRPADKSILLRVGVHLGDVIHDKDDVYGDAVNVASRIEPLASPGGICVTAQVYDQIKNKLEFPLSSLGKKELKNVGEPIEVFAVVLPWEKEDEARSRPDARRIAILPFANFSPDPNDAYFADGITEEIISTVSGISGLSVISRTSVMGYKGTTKKVKEIGRELEVGSILEGSFRKAGSRIRITTQLIDVASDHHIWAQNYDRELDDVFAVQSDIASEVASSLRIKILPREEAHIRKRPTTDPRAYALYLKGRYHWNLRSKEGLLKAIEEYKAAIALDAEYALAYSGIADCYAVLGNHGHLPYAEAFPKSREYALKAVELDDTSAEAHTSLANAMAQNREGAAEEEYERAIELSPSYATAHHWHGILLLHKGRGESALEEALSAQELDPLSPQIATFVGQVHSALGQYEQEETQYLRALELQPDFVPAIANLWGSYGHQKKVGDAERQSQTYLKATGDELGYKLWLAAQYALEGRVTDARRVMKEAQAIPNPEHRNEEATIAYHSILGEIAEAVQEVEDEFERGADWLSDILYDPWFSAVRTDPRVESVLKKIGALPQTP